MRMRRRRRREGGGRRRLLRRRSGRKKSRRRRSKASKELCMMQEGTTEWSMSILRMHLLGEGGGVVQDGDVCHSMPFPLPSNNATHGC